MREFQAPEINNDYFFISREKFAWYYFVIYVSDTLI